jgi:hypothetical protein
MSERVRLSEYEKIRALSFSEGSESTPQTIVGKTENPEDWELITYTGSGQRLGILLIGKLARK